MAHDPPGSGSLMHALIEGNTITAASWALLTIARALTAATKETP